MHVPACVRAGSQIPPRRGARADPFRLDFISVPAARELPPRRPLCRQLFPHYSSHISSRGLIFEASFFFSFASRVCGRSSDCGARARLAQLLNTRGRTYFRRGRRATRIDFNEIQGRIVLLRITGMRFILPSWKLDACINRRRNVYGFCRTKSRELRLLPSDFVASVAKINFEFRSDFSNFSSAGIENCT